MERLFPTIVGKCKSCGRFVFEDFPTEELLVEENGLDNIVENDDYDFIYFCSNRRCKYHRGIGYDEFTGAGSGWVSFFRKEIQEELEVTKFISNKEKDVRNLSGYGDERNQEDVDNAFYIN